MKFHFSVATMEEVKSAIDQVLVGMELPVDVKIKVNGDDLTVSIIKVGTSVLSFSKFANMLGSSVELVKEDISVWHKGQIEAVKGTFVDIVQKAGGTILKE